MNRNAGRTSQRGFAVVSHRQISSLRSPPFGAFPAAITGSGIDDNEVHRTNEGKTPQ